MNRFQNKTFGPYNGLMSLVLIFLLVDIAIAALLVFNVNLPDFSNKATDNNAFNKPTVTTNVTDNAVKPTVTR